MLEALQEFGANPGRSGHRMATRAAEKINQTRSRLASLFHVKNPNDVVFAQNATEALNLGLKGFLKPGDHVITTSLEHNSVRRPLEYLRKIGIDITYVRIPDNHGVLLTKLEEAIRPETKLIVVTHASNLTGELLPIGEIGHLADKHDIRFMVDASQTAGVYPIDVEEMKIALLAFTGHKSLYGPQGTGGLYIHPELELEPILHGGTGGYSELVEQPAVRPDRYESGTRNTVGIAGLGAGLAFLEATGMDRIRKHEEELARFLMEELAGIKGLTLYGPGKGKPRCPIVSFAVEGYDSNEIGFILDTHYEIAVRSGLHCSPLAHEALGTIEKGLVRASPGYFNTEKDIEELIRALKDIVS